MILAAIRAYQSGISPLLGARCRFYPSCSSYASAAIERFGVWRGCTLAGFRVLRCNPLCAGGIDPVPATFPPRPWRRAPAPAAPHDEPPHP